MSLSAPLDIASGQSPTRLPAPAPACFIGVLLLGGFAHPGAAQSLRGRVLAEGDETPVPSAYLRLQDADGVAVAVTFADSAGRYGLEAPSPGEYRIVVEQIGYEGFTSPLLSVERPDRTYPLDVLLRRQPIPIEGVVVSAVRREVLEQAIQKELGLHPSSLRFAPIGPEAIQEHADRGRNVEDLIRWENTPSLFIRGTGASLCFRYRNRYCLPVHLDGMRLSPGLVPVISLDMLESAVVVAPGESLVYRRGAILLYSRGYLR